MAATMAVATMAMADCQNDFGQPKALVLVPRAGTRHRAPAQRIRQSPRLAELEAGGATTATTPTNTNTNHRAGSRARLCAQGPCLPPMLPPWSAIGASTGTHSPVPRVP